MWTEGGSTGLSRTPWAGKSREGQSPIDRWIVFSPPPNSSSSALLDKNAAQMSAQVAPPQSQAALLLSFHPHARPLAVVLGSIRLATSRAHLFLLAGQQVLVVDDKPLASTPVDLQARVERKDFEYSQGQWRDVLDQRREEVGLVCVVDSGTSPLSLCANSASDELDIIEPS